MRAGLLFALVAIVAAAFFYLGSQSREPAGPAERFGKALDESAEQARKNLEKLKDDVEEAVKEREEAR